jgi:hypothetical protein
MPLQNNNKSKIFTKWDINNFLYFRKYVYYRPGSSCRGVWGLNYRSKKYPEEVEIPLYKVLLLSGKIEKNVNP